MLLSSLLPLGLGQGPQSDTPGFAFLGSGYDVLSGNPLATDGLGDPGFRNNLFEWKYEKGLTTPDNVYKVADKTQSRVFQDCTNSMDEKIYNSAYSYKKIIETNFDINVGIGLKNKSSVNFDLGVDVRNTRNHTDNKSRIYSHVTAVCTRYQLSMNVFDQADLSSDFQRGVAMMPTEFDMESYVMLLNVFGTHYVSAMKVGGRWGMQMEFKSEDYQALIDKYVNVHAGIKFVAGSVNGGLTINSTTDRKTTYDISHAIYKNSTFSIGGDFSADSLEWMKSVTKAPMPVHLTLNRIDQLFNKFALPDEDPAELTLKKQNIAKAMDNWCQYHEDSVEGFSCKAQEEIPMPTPTPIGGNAIRRVCVENSGAFLIYWHMITPGGIGAQTDSFAVGDIVCIDGDDVVAEYGDALGCRVKAVTGREVDCDQPWYDYNEDSMLQSNYKCEGSTLSIKCSFNGISKIGAEGGGRRRTVSQRLLK